METMTILLLMLACWIQQSDTTVSDCTLHICSQPLAFNLLCPDITCRLEIQTTTGCNIPPDTPTCHIGDCNRTYNLCNATQSLLNVSSEVSPTSSGEELGGGQIIHNDEEHINCMFFVAPPTIIVRCQKRECSLTATSNTTTCRLDLGLGINCDTGHPDICYRTYNLCTTTEPLPTACASSSETITSGINTTEQTFPEHTPDIHITEHNQNTETITVQSSSKDGHASNYSPQTVYRTTTVHMSACPTPTTQLSPPIIMTSNVSRYPYPALSSSSSTCICSLGSKIYTTSQILIKTDVIIISPNTSTSNLTPLPTSSPVSETATMQTSSVTPTLSKSPKTNTKVDMLSITSINTSYPSPPACSPATEATTMQTIPLNIVAPATGALVGLLLVLLLVVTTGWVCTCRTMRKRGGMKISLMEDSFPNSPNTYDGIQLHTSTLRTFDKSLCEEQKQATPVVVTPPTKPKIQHQVTLLTKPKPTHRQSGGPVYAIPVTSSKRKHMKSTNIENTANQIQSGIKQKGDQHSKGDERVDSERGHEYHVLEEPGNNCDDSDKQKKVNDYHTLKGPTKEEKEPRNIYVAANKVLPDGGVSVGVAAPIQGKQEGGIEHEYDKLIKVIKQKGDQSKRDERVGSERGHMYHILEGPGNDYDDPGKQKKGHILEGPTKGKEEPRNIHGEANKVLPDGGVSVGVATQIQGKQGSIEHVYDKLVKIVKQKGDQSKRDERVDSEKEHMYHVLEGPGDEYNDPNEQKKGNIYHILEGPTKGEEEPRNIYGVANKVLPNGGVSVGVATLIQRKQGTIVYEYDKPVKVVKQKRDQSKGDERVDSERGHMYHVLEGPGDDPDKQREGNVYHILEGPMKEKEASRNIQGVTTQVLPGGGIPVRAATKIQGKQRGAEHEYAKLVKVVKQKVDQSKRVERVDSGRGHMYHVLEGPGDDYDDPGKQKQGNVYHVLEGPTKVNEEPRNIHGVANQVLSGGGVSVGVATQTRKLQKEFEHQYDKLIKVEKQTGSQSTKTSGSGINSENSKEGKEHVYHILEGPGGGSDNSQDELERENIYHVLEGPTPVEEEI